MLRFEDSPPPRMLETDIDRPPRSINGDLNRLRCGGANGNRRNAPQPHDLGDSEPQCNPTDTMLSHSTKLPIPDDDDDVVGLGRAPPDRLQRMANKHGLTRKGLVMLLGVSGLCLGLLIGMLAMTVMWPRSEDEDARDICLSPDCLRASAQLQGSLDGRIAPCTDFWMYSCGGWVEDNPIPPTRSKWSVTEKLKYNALAEMRVLLDTMDEPEDVNSVEWKLKTFYWSCMNVKSYMQSGLNLLKRRITTELCIIKRGCLQRCVASTIAACPSNTPLETAPDDGMSPKRRAGRKTDGWNLMRETWDLRRWEFDSVLTKLHAEYGVSPYFKVDVVSDPRRPGQNIIKILPSGFSMPHRSYYYRLPNNEVEKAYKQYIKDTVKMFEASGPDAIEFASHLFNYEKRIAEITPSEEKLNDPLVSNVQITIGELSQIARSIPWLDLLRNMFPESKLDHRTEILVISKEYFSDLSELITTTDRSMQNKYLIFTFVAAYMPYLSDKNKRVLDLFRKEFTGAQEPLERWEFCIQTTAKYFGYGLTSLYERNHARLKARERNIDVVTDIFHQIRKTFAVSLAYSQWYPPEIKSFFQSKLNNMTISVGYPDRLLDPLIINEYYREYTIFTKDFFKNLEDSIRNSRRHMELRLINPPAEASWMEFLTGSHIQYVHEANKIVIPPHLLNPPFFHRNYPKSMLYGSIGIRITREMLKAFDMVGISWDAKGHLVVPTPFANTTVKNLKGVAQCVATTTMSLAVEDDTAIDHTAHDTATEVSAVRQAYQSYLNLLKVEPQPLSPSFEAINTTNIFFMSYAGCMCSDATVQQEDIDRTCSTSLRSRPKLEAVLSQLPEFTRVFHCDKDSRHFPHRPCKTLQ